MKHSRATSAQGATKKSPLELVISLPCPKMRLICADIGIIHAGNGALLVVVNTTNKGMSVL
jgi:hypothetical protein